MKNSLLKLFVNLTKKIACKQALLPIILLASISANLQSHFIRSAIYRNEKTGQIIILLGDIHHPESIKDSNKQQKNALIKNLIKLAKQPNLTLTEDTEEYDSHKNNIRFVKSKEFTTVALKSIGT